MLSREIVRSTRNLIIQHLVFASSSVTTTTKSTTKSLGRRHKSTSVASGSVTAPTTPPASSQDNTDSLNSHKRAIQSLFANNEPSVIKGKSTSFEWEIMGHESQVIQLQLDPDSSITAETGALLEMSSTMEMETSARGGFMSSIKRMFTGQGIFLTKFKNSSLTETGRITFSSPYISKILAIKMADIGGELICKKNAFLCGENDIEIGPRITNRFSIGFFGGQGFILQKLTGNGMVFIHGSGSIIYRMLKPQETIKVSTGCIVAFESSITYDIAWVSGATNILFSGEGLFLATLSGPGLVILQSLPFEKLVSAIASQMPISGSSSSMSSSSPSSSDQSSSSSSSSSR
ncbi:hypothetical protein SAMD00019534_090130 [Acytostelium subglobosum LB1]|uniref:hypothetical protein n=1 Tax=Acytostelium subglobosum LB1 TaxID=1410327 RepID=UPI0006449942|nr:hypothetical protein SAMD00019534_090130 [Acytostelium subglobosum LB1]GAM25838.1 hypothetical protein SAMD00019534_090130 [Acytostelium subglobosum LB1]|eukprot:XP_012751356.1 hypothetical protein SAMD00019534_090130 [Acytostelium subglobosum LB1]